MTAKAKNGGKDAGAKVPAPSSNRFILKLERDMNLVEIECGRGGLEGKLDVVEIRGVAELLYGYKRVTDMWRFKADESGALKWKSLDVYAVAKSLLLRNPDMWRRRFREYVAAHEPPMLSDSSCNDIGFFEDGTPEWDEGKVVSRDENGNVAVRLLQYGCVSDEDFNASQKWIEGFVESLKPDGYTVRLRRIGDDGSKDYTIEYTVTIEG